MNFAFVYDCFNHLNKFIIHCMHPQLHKLHYNYSDKLAEFSFMSFWTIGLIPHEVFT